jgi:hypothetical protein
MVALCRHIKTDNTLCASPAIKGTLFCYNHTRVRAAVRHAQPLPDPYGTHPPLAFVFPEDHAAIQINLFLVIQALNDKMIDIRLANTYNRLFRSCELNLEKWDAANAANKKAETADRVILTPEGEEIGMPRLVLKDGERAPVHGPKCPCPICDEEYRGAPQEQHHANCKCGLCGDNTDQPSPTSDQHPLQPSTNPSQPSTNGCHSERSGAPTDRSSSVGWRSEESAVLFSDVILSKREARNEGPAVSQPSHESTTQGNDNLSAATRDVPANQIVTTPLDPIESINQRFFAKEIHEYEEKCAAEDRAAREAGLEPPSHEPWSTNIYLAEDKRRHEEEMAQIRKNQEIALEIMKRRFPHLTPEEPSLMSWGDEEDRMLAKKKEQAAATRDQATGNTA